MKLIEIDERWGLADVVVLGHLAEVHRRRGTEVLVSVPPRGMAVLKAMGVPGELHSQAGQALSPVAAGHPVEELADRYESYNWAVEMQRYLEEKDLVPHIPAKALWRELLELVPAVRGKYADDGSELHKAIQGLTSPRVLLAVQCGIGSGADAGEGERVQSCATLCRELLERTTATVIVTEPLSRYQRVLSYRVRPLREFTKNEQFQELGAETILSLLASVDLVITDRPDIAQLTRLTGTLMLGLWNTRSTYPSRYFLPHKFHVHLVPSVVTRDLNLSTRTDYNIVESSGAALDPVVAAEIGSWMQEPAKYLREREDATAPVGADIVLRQFLRWTNGRPGKLAANVDRHKSFAMVLDLVKARFKAPRAVETGCVRASEDWGGAGYFSYLFGYFLKHHGGTLVSVDLSEESCDFARYCTRSLPVEVVQGDSVQYLANRVETIDVLYLDSLDLEEPDHAQHGLRETQAAQKCLHADSVVIIDDTAFQDGRWRGKGAEAVPWMLEQGWRIEYAGYQAILTRNSPQ